MQKTILITGASSGFGHDTALTLSRAGHTVFGSMRDIAGRNRGPADALRSKGIEVVEFDVTDDKSVEAGVAEVLAKTGRIDVLVNNAGIASAGVSEAFTPDQARAMFDTNVIGLLRVTRAVLPAMRKQGDGLIANIGSFLGRVTLPFIGIYGASKFAVEAVSDSYRYELSQLGVDVVLLEPSFYPTSLFGVLQRPADTARAASYGALSQIPDQMFQTIMGIFQGENAPNPHDVAEAIVKLVAQPKGTRPARVIVGAPFGSDAVNASTAPVQQQVVESLGLGALTNPAVTSPVL